MVKIKKLIPSDVTLNLLAKLHGPVTIARPVRVIAGITQIYLFASGDVISIITSYHDVVFKFEIFALQAEPVTSLPPTIELGRIGDWDEIVCLVRFEWLRPAKKGELPAGYGPLLGETGKKTQIPHDAVNVAVSMIGILFRASGRNVAVITSDETDGNIVNL